MIQASIRSQASEGDILTRINTVLDLYYRPDRDPAAEARVLEEYVRALRHFPAWAINRACDAWNRTGKRRPTPGELVELIDMELKPWRDELEHRRRMAAAQAEDQRPRPDPVSPSRADEIVRAAGFTPERIEALRRRPMAGSMAEADQVIRTRELDPDEYLFPHEREALRNSPDGKLTKEEPRK